MDPLNLVKFNAVSIQDTLHLVTTGEVVWQGALEPVRTIVMSALETKIFASYLSFHVQINAVSTSATKIFI